MKKSKIIICLISALLISASSTIIPNTQVVAQAFAFEWEYHKSYQTYASRDNIGVDVALKFDSYNNNTDWHPYKVLATFYDSDNKFLSSISYTGKLSKEYSFSRRFYLVNNWKKLVIKYYVDDKLIDTRTFITKY